MLTQAQSPRPRTQRQQSESVRYTTPSPPVSCQHVATWTTEKAEEIPRAPMGLALLGAYNVPRVAIPDEILCMSASWSTVSDCP